MIIVTLQGHLRARQSEWIVSLILAAWGLVLLHPVETFNGVNFSWFANSGVSETVWGVVFLIIGLFRIVGLYINGRRATITSWMRFLSSSCGFMLFLVTSIGFVSSGVPSTSWAVYPLLAVSEAVNIYFSMIDAGAAWRKSQVVSQHHADRKS